ncbi:MAG TPA: TMEM175 family protein [Candidatus Polarisedimenticolaceae bacterium]|nr:TMEM175 family protein [Candidatus Polarisedimenticolaceae bacterium]
MIREHLFSKRVSADPMFRWRGGEVSRIEGLSDAVFAFALTLLVVSLEVPSTFDELSRTIRSFPAFAACFFLLVNVWYYHYKFFRRYGMEDFFTVSVNAVLLFIVLFYVYPLKFVFSNLIDPLFGIDHSVVDADGTRSARVFAGHGRPLMLFFSAGFALIATLFIVMHVHAWRRRDELELDRLERFLTWAAIQAQLVSLTLALISIVLASIGGSWVPWSGLIYFLMGPAHGINGYLSGVRAERMLDAMQRPTAPD